MISVKVKIVVTCAEEEVFEKKETGSFYGTNNLFFNSGSGGREEW